MPEKEPSIGALWTNDSVKGTYLKGNIEGVGSVVVFQNRSDNPKAPQWKVYRSRPKADAKPAAPVVDDKGIDF